MERILKRIKKSESSGDGSGFTRRLCGKGRRDNELYRSNSFKFERFDKSESQLDLALIGKQVSLCDDYAVPVDFVNKRRPLSIGSAPFSWDRPSPHSDNVEILEVYCDPRDSKAYVDPGEEVAKLYTDPERSYVRPCPTHNCSSPTEEDGEVYEDVGGRQEEGLRTPYYYGDLTSEDNTSVEDRMSPRLLDDADAMSRRKLYETAFDSKISKSDDDLDIDEVTHKSIIVAEERRGDEEEYYKRPRSLVRAEQIQDRLCDEMRQLDLKPFVAPTPPSSAPLPAKFHSHSAIANASSSVQSTPDLPVRAKDLRLPIKSSKHRTGLRARSCHPQSHNDSNRSLFEEQEKGKPRGLEILEIKGRPRRMKYSSTESMATSSSGGSLESIRSSTSEGNRSTSSCESRRSSSLSSHSSDSTSSGPGFHHPTINCLNTRVFQQNKLNILSPISDKSSQEPCSETSENNKNNNSERASPEEVLTPTGESQKKRRTPQNRNIISLGISLDQQEAQQGSDSGISIESRTAGKNSNELCDLPFDMPKLRRRRMMAQESPPADTSGSATSVDLRDLPFDMPKLRRRLRPTPSLNSQASSSSAPQDGPIPGLVSGRGSLSLDLGESEGRRLFLDFPPPPPLPAPAAAFLPPPSSSQLVTASPSSPVELIDISLPLERQGWYHGAITRLEAENILRLNREGSFLVRNSESTKQDYSLSLKSARGFMHMRIQKCKETAKYILGQFSNPFSSIPEMIRFYSLNRLPIRGAEHMCLSHPIIEQLL